jgi:hypothetical protein
LNFVASGILDPNINEYKPDSFINIVLESSFSNMFLFLSFSGGEKIPPNKFDTINLSLSNICFSIASFVLTYFNNNATSFALKYILLS